jgi:hypothetical protein
MSMHCAKATRLEKSNSSSVWVLPPRALERARANQEEGREEWLRQREQKGSTPTLEEIRAKGREDWLKLQQPKDLSESPDKGLDDDLN